MQKLEVILYSAFSLSPHIHPSACPVSPTSNIYPAFGCPSPPPRSLPPQSSDHRLLPGPIQQYSHRSPGPLLFLPLLHRAWRAFLCYMSDHDIPWLSTLPRILFHCFVTYKVLKVLALPRFASLLYLPSLALLHPHWTSQNFSNMASGWVCTVSSAWNPFPQLMSHASPKKPCRCLSDVTSPGSVCPKWKPPSPSLPSYPALCFFTALISRYCHIFCLWGGTGDHLTAPHWNVTAMTACLVWRMNLFPYNRHCSECCGPSPAPNRSPLSCLPYFPMVKWKQLHSFMIARGDAWCPKLNDVQHSVKKMKEYKENYFFTKAPRNHSTN